MSIASEITALQTDKTNIKAAIIAKGGTSSSESGFDDFATDIGTIPSGLFTASQLRSPQYCCNYVDFGNKSIEITFQYYGTDSLNWRNAFYCIFNLTKAKISASFSPTNLASFFENGANTNLVLSEIEIDFDTSAVTNWNNAFRSVGTDQSTVRVDITGRPLNLSAATNVNTAFEYNRNLYSVFFVANTIPLSISFSRSLYLTEATLVSIANGLNSTVSGKALTLHATPKARCSTLMGTVTDGVFTQDDTGTVSLQTFITDEKGWTLA